MRLKKLSQNFEQNKDYANEQKLVLSSIISRINRIGDFFDVVVKLEKFMIEEVRDEYNKLIEIRHKKLEIERSEGKAQYIEKHFLPAVEVLSKKIETSIQSWNYVEKEYTTGKVFGFVGALKNFYKELEKMDKVIGNKDEDLHEFSMTTVIKDILDNFGRFKMYKAIMTDDTITKVETLLSMQEDITELKEPDSKPKSLTLDDL